MSSEAPKELNSKMNNRAYKDTLQSFVNYYATEEQNNALALMLDKKELVSYFESENYLESLLKKMANIDTALR